jgi:hypothetical protein
METSVNYKTVTTVSRPPRVAGPLDRTLIERLEYWKTLGPLAISDWGSLLLDMLIELASTVNSQARPSTIDPVVLEQNLVIQNIIKRLDELEANNLGPNVSRILLDHVKIIDSRIESQSEKIFRLQADVIKLTSQVAATKRRTKPR